MQRPSLSTEESLLAVDSDGRIMHISPACMNILHTEREPVGQKLEEVLGKSSDLVSACREVFHHPEKTYPYRLRFGLTDDASKTLLASLYPLKRGGRTVGIIVTLRDLRQIRREEMRIRRTERLSMLARLAASLAHEIRNPLNAIVINLEVLKNVIKQLPPKSLQKANGYVGILSEELERLNNALDNFLGLANPIEVMRSNIEVNRIVKDALTLMRHQAEQVGIEICDNIDSSPIYVEGNEDQLKQAILNLVLNAIEAMPDGGRLSIATRKDPDQAIIEVGDTGLGIPEEIQDDIFDFYFTTKEEGTGLGLPIVARIVEFHRGGMDLESTEGEGTKFTVELPLSVS
jgi:two-component system, sporulation sensor kinase E